jgi:hypothetical protein
VSDQKTRPTDVSVESFLAGVPDARKRADADRLIQIMTAITGDPPVMWGASIIGFGSYHYRYQSGHEGDAPLVGFSPRKKAHSIYLSCDLSLYQDVLDRLGKHRMGKGCLYITRLPNVDEAVLEELIRASIAEVKSKS